MKKRFYFQVKSRLSLFKADDFIKAVNLYVENLPQYMPRKWGWYEPFVNIFNPQHLETLLENGKGVDVFWERPGKNRASGEWMTRWVSGVPNARDTHSTIASSFYDSQHQKKLIEFLVLNSVELDGDFAFIDAMPSQYKLIAVQNSFSPFGSFLSLSTHILRHWLPDMPWAVVFGPAYVRMFGKEKLMSCPAYKVEDIGPEYVYIQLTSSMDDIYDKYESVMEARDQAKEHLGRECFFRADLAYDYKKEYQKAGKVFRAPEFHLIED